MVKRVTKELEFIKNFQKITLIKILNDFKINRSNLYCGLTTNENEKKIAMEIINRCTKLFNSYLYEDLKNE